MYIRTRTYIFIREAYIRWSKNYTNYILKAPAIFLFDTLCIIIYNINYIGVIYKK